MNIMQSVVRLVNKSILLIGYNHLGISTSICLKKNKDEENQHQITKFKI